MDQRFVAVSYSLFLGQRLLLKPIIAGQMRLSWGWKQGQQASDYEMIQSGAP